MARPENLLYSKTHEWVRVDGDIATVGITDYAQEQLGDVVMVDFPAVGKAVQAGQEMGTVESVKAVSEVFSPVSGEVVEVNGELEAHPELVNQDPFGSGWLVKIKVSQVPSDLMDAKAYEQFVQEEGGH
ncbi:glycine cleavage system protein H [Thermoanaerobaculum aquaticum]|mgnify:CR=1 FL=1|jgi:glycine cleavage system H protein|uniref:Glycine cleavage system H protein n=1 Tax=Thermoanaerobaculum aquaticum TaxID=1312852 RepID=A0A062XZ64_9BACT|nr:glycine cleavage system protein GcvH [Thermoanaerobaculum aquaticum]KDA53805.1 glycine cleavage system protein H [Thermoanaerobaculum aquaticum]BCW93799.1 MAG: glycine cleavage system H protein [Thermoanaerobaculum sp.]